MKNSRIDATDKIDELPGDSKALPNFLLPNEGSCESTPAVQDSDKEVIVVNIGQVPFQPRSQVTRSGRVTKIPSRFKE